MAVDKITAPKVMNELCDHITKHRDVYDPRSEKMHNTLYGQTGVNGLSGKLEIQSLCMSNIEKRMTEIDATLKERVSKIEKNINWGVLLILGIFITSVAKLVIK